jgi:HEAT repeat protein
MRALGTCGTERGAEAVLVYLRSEPTISTSLPGEAIWPLLQRGVLTRERLIKIVQHTKASIQGRTAAIMALGILDAPRNKALCHEIIDQVEDETLRAYAVRMLGMAQDGASIAKLQLLLRQTKNAFVAEQAALALARLNAHQAVSDIECALEEFAETEHAVDLVNALERLRRPSSLPVLREALQRSRFLDIRAEIIEALGAFLPDQDAKQIILKQLETWMGGNIDLGEQCPAIRALARYDPNLLLDLVKNLYDVGRLDRSAREELARLIPYLVKKDGVERTALFEIIKRLICDQDLPVRERTAQTFGRIDPTFCVEIYNELRHGVIGESKACPRIVKSNSVRPLFRRLRSTAFDQFMDGYDTSGSSPLNRGEVRLS